MTTPYEFILAFDSAFKLTRKNTHWSTPKERTTSIASYIYSTIAQYFNMRLTCEYNEIDAALFKHAKTSNDNSVLSIAIEHENLCTGCKNETNKLLSTECDLGVLITYMWDGEKSRPNFREENYRDNLCKGVDFSNTKLAQPLLLIVADERHLPNLVWSYYLVDSTGKIHEQQICCVDVKTKSHSVVSVASNSVATTRTR